MEALSSLSEEDRASALKLMNFSEDDKAVILREIETEKKSVEIAKQALEAARAASDFSTAVSSEEKKNLATTFKEMSCRPMPWPEILPETMAILQMALHLWC